MLAKLAHLRGITWVAVASRSTSTAVFRFQHCLWCGRCERSGSIFLEPRPLRCPIHLDLHAIGVVGPLQLLALEPRSTSIPALVFAFSTVCHPLANQQVCSCVETSVTSVTSACLCGVLSAIDRSTAATQWTLRQLRKRFVWCRANSRSPLRQHGEVETAVSNPRHPARLSALDELRVSLSPLNGRFTIRRGSAVRIRHQKDGRVESLATGPSRPCVSMASMDSLDGADENKEPAYDTSSPPPEKSVRLRDRLSAC